MTTPLLLIENDGPLIAHTNYFESEHAKAGLYYLSWNAGCARLLVPDEHLPSIADMKTARGPVVISRGPLHGRDAIELLFDDESDAPFAIHIEMRQSDRVVTDDPGEFRLDAWTRAGRVESWPARYRTVGELPCLLPWIDTGE